MKARCMRPAVVGILVAGLWAAGAPFAGAAESGFKVIAHPATSAASLKRAQVSALFLKKVTRWPDGTPAHPVDRETRAPVREAFSMVVHAQSTNSVVSYWNQQIFSGRETPPPVVTSDAAVVAFVLGRPGAIGYVSADAPVAGVKVMSVE